jgi:hypothetical protein
VFFLYASFLLASIKHCQHFPIKHCPIMSHPKNPKGN